MLLRTLVLQFGETGIIELICFPNLAIGSLQNIVPQITNILLWAENPTIFSMRKNTILNQRRFNLVNKHILVCDDLVVRIIHVIVLNPGRPKEDVFCVVVGVVLSTVVHHAAPGFAANSGLWGRIWLFSLSMPLQMCEHGVVMFAQSLLHAGLSHGTAFVFLVVAPAVNAATLLFIYYRVGAEAVGVGPALFDRLRHFGQLCGGFQWHPVALR